jgi:hypothetical protein
MGSSTDGNYLLFLIAKLRNKRWHFSWGVFLVVCFVPMRQFKTRWREKLEQIELWVISYKIEVE